MEYYVWYLIALVVSSLLLWLMLYLASRWIESKSYAEDKKTELLLTAFIIVIILPIIADGVAFILNAIGVGIAEARTAINPSGSNYLINLVPVINFLVFLTLLKFIADMAWKKALWVSLLGIFLLYCLYSFFPELDLLKFL